MGRLTILSIAYPFAPVGEDAVGGAEQILACLDRALVQRRHASIVLAAEGSRVRGALLAHPMPTLIDDAAKKQAWMRYMDEIADVLDAAHVDVVHMHGVDFAQYLPASRAAVVVTLHLPPSWYPPRVFQLERPRTRFVCVSLTQRVACPPSRIPIDVIPNGVRLDAYVPREKDKREYAVVLGRVCPEKGIHLAVEAARLSEMDLVIAGEVFPYEEHERYFEERLKPALDERRRYVGPVGLCAKRELLDRARCLLVPSLAPETSSLVAMEALASGTPVVAFRTGALPEVVEHGRTGFLVADVDEMADAIRHVGELSPDDCRYAAETRFDATRMCERYLALYDELASATRAEARP